MSPTSNTPARTFGCWWPFKEYMDHNDAFDNPIRQLWLHHFACLLICANKNTIFWEKVTVK